MHPPKRNLPRPAQRMLDWVRTKMWSQIQKPDPAQLYAQGGTFMLCAFLRQCWSPDVTKQVLERHGADIHPETWPIGPHISVHEPGPDFSNLSVGAFSHLGKEVFLDLTDRIIIEDSVSLGMRAMILTHLNVGEYPNKPIAKLVPKKQQPTILRRGCSVGAGAVILCGVEIGEDAVIGAGIVVDQDVPPGTIVSSSRHKADYQIPARLLDKARRALQR